MIVKIPARQWAVLATIAERRGVLIADLLVEAVQTVTERQKSALAAEPLVVSAKQAADIRLWHSQHVPFTEMAKRLRIDYRRVMKAGKQLGLPNWYGSKGGRA